MNSTAPHQLPGAALLALREKVDSLSARIKLVDQQIAEQEADLERTRRTMLRLLNTYTGIIGVIGEQPSLAEDLARGDARAVADAETADFVHASLTREVQS